MIYDPRARRIMDVLLEIIDDYEGDCPEVYEKGVFRGALAVAWKIKDEFEYLDELIDALQEEV